MLHKTRCSRNNLSYLPGMVFLPNTRHCQPKSATVRPVSHRLGESTPRKSLLGAELLVGRLVLQRARAARRAVSSGYHTNARGESRVVPDSGAARRHARSAPAGGRGSDVAHHERVELRRVRQLHLGHPAIGLRRGVDERGVVGQGIVHLRDLACSRRARRGGRGDAGA